MFYVIPYFVSSAADTIPLYNCTFISVICVLIGKVPSSATKGHNVNRMFGLYGVYKYMVCVSGLNSHRTLSHKATLQLFWRGRPQVRFRAISDMVGNIVE